MKNRKYIYFGLVAVLAILFLAQANSYADERYVAVEKTILDGKDNDGSTFKGKKLEPIKESDSDKVVDKGKKIYRGRNLEFVDFYLLVGKLVNERWYVLQDK